MTSVPSPAGRQVHSTIRTLSLLSMGGRTMHCSGCGSQVSDLARFCPSCGTPCQTLAAAPPAPGDGATPISGSRRFAGFWYRVLASLIDALVVNVGAFFVVLPLALAVGFSMSGNATSSEIKAAGGVLGYVLGTFLSWLYYTLLESSRWQATLGKKLLGLKVTDLLAGRISFGRQMPATGRRSCRGSYCSWAFSWWPSRETSRAYTTKSRAPLCFGQIHNEACELVRIASGPDRGTLTRELSIPEDELRALETLNAESVTYLLIGGFAMRFHGVDRLAKDVDLLARSSPLNAQRLFRAIEGLVGRPLEYSAQDLEKPRKKVSLRRYGYELDILTSIEGIDFDAEYHSRETALEVAVPIPVISLDGLLRIKRTAAKDEKRREKELNDIGALKSIATVRRHGNLSPKAT